MDGIPLEDYRWLLSGDSLDAREAANAHQDTLHRLVRKLQQAPYRLSTERIHLVLTQLELRSKTAEKFPCAERMWVEATLLEQATDEPIAVYKAMRFPQGVPVVDLCCGLGGDLVALAARGPVTAVDHSPIALALAEANVRSRALEADAQFSAMAAEDYVANDFSKAAAGRRWVHIDPDRRADGVRTSAWEFAQPGPETLDRLRLSADGAAIKLAPATVAPAAWADACERDWVGSRGQCRQQVLWTGQLTDRAGARAATVVTGNSVERFLPHDDDATPPLAQQPGRYVLEPHRALLAAHLGEAFGAEHGLELAAPHGGYLTGDTAPPISALATRFEVIDWLPLDAKRVRKRLRDFAPARLEVKRRGVPETPEQILRKIKWKPDRKLAGKGDVLTMIVARFEQRVVAMFCRREEAPRVATDSLG